MSLHSSILDLATVYNNDDAIQTLKNSTELTQLADQLGYSRYWFAEHHNTKFQVSTSPDLLAVHVAAVTERLTSVQAASCCLNSPLKVVENFSLLKSHHPNQIDLGIGQAPGTDGMTAMALRRSLQKKKRLQAMAQVNL